MEFSVIELPFKCSSIEEAKGIYDPAISKKLSLHPQSSPIPPTIVKGCGLVIEEGKMEIVGKISEFIRFRHMADFHLKESKGDSLPPMDYLLNNDDSNEVSLLKKASDTILNCPSISNLPLFLPSTLSTFSFPHQTQTQPTLSAQLKDPSKIDPHSVKKGKQSSWIMSFSDFEKEVFAPKELLNRVRRLYLSNYERVFALFEERPIYLRSTLRHLLQIGGDKASIPELELRAIMPTVAYFFIDGPWRSCWVRYGYDPRKNDSNINNSRLYQVLEMRNANISQMIESFPSSLRKRVLLQQKKENMYMAPIFDGNHLLTDCMSQFQYIDLTYQVIRTYLLSLPNRHELDRREGWFPDGTNSHIRKILIERWYSLLKEIDPIFFEEFQKSAESIYKSIRASTRDGIADINMIDNVVEECMDGDDDDVTSNIEEEIRDTTQALEDDDIYELLF